MSDQPATATPTVFESIVISRALDAAFAAWKAGVLTDAEWETRSESLKADLHEAAAAERALLGIGVSAVIPPVVAPDELIESAWGNAVVAALSEHEGELTRIVETRTVTLAATALGLTTTATALPPAMSLGGRGYDRLILLSTATLFTRTAGTAELFDIYLSITGNTGGAGSTRRHRFSLGDSGSLTSSFLVPANVVPTVTTLLGTNASTANIATAGSGDLNYLSAVMIPIAGFGVIPAMLTETGDDQGATP